MTRTCPCAGVRSNRAPSSTEPHLAPQNPPYTRTPDLRKLVQGVGREVRSPPARRKGTPWVSSLKEKLLADLAPPLERRDRSGSSRVSDRATTGGRGFGW